MTHLNFLDKLTYKKLGKFKYKNCSITFWTDNNQDFIKTKIGNEGFLRIIFTVFKSLKYFEKFQEFDIIFEFNLIKLLDINNQESNCGHVTIKDINLKKNIIYLNVIGIDSISYDKAKNNFIAKNKAGLSQVELQKEINNKTEELLKSGEVNFYKSLQQTVGHELTHIWHIKTSEAIKIRDNNLKRFEKISCEIREEGEAIENLLKIGLTNLDLKIKKDSLFKLYVSIRKNLLIVEDMFCTEGMAEFTSNYINDNINFDQLYNEANKYSEIFKKKYELIIEYFKMLTDCILGEKSKKITNQLKLNELVEKIMKELPKLIELLRSLTYKIGPVIPATLFDKGNMTIEEIGNLNPNKLIKKYVKVCQIHEITPIISNESNIKSIINIYTLLNEINSARKV